MLRSVRFCSVLVLLVLVTGCSRNAATGRNQLTLASPEAIAAMGVEAMPQMVEEFGGAVQSAELRAYVTEVGRSIAAQVEPQYQDIEWEFTTLNSDVVNAFALPGGKVFITRGLLSKFDNEAQVAAVLGHEVGHVTARHVDERVSQSILAEGLLSVVGIVTESQLVTQGATMAAQGALLKFGRDQESESDALGLRYMAGAGYDPSAMIEVLEVLMAESAAGRDPEFLSTHPYPETRLERTRAILDSAYPDVANDSRYRKYPERFAQRALPYLR